MQAVILLELSKEIPEAWLSQLTRSRTTIDRISENLLGSTYIPKRGDVFRALEVDPDRVRVVIVGQDPYPNREHAMGLAFSVRSGVHPLPASLRNIFTELYEDVGVRNMSGDLSSWVDQGVLLLNRVLTTTPENSLGHAGLGWEKVSEEIIEIASRRKPVAILWGKKAQELSKYFEPDRTIISAHPSPLSAYRGFFGSKPFSRTNELLASVGTSPINWQTY